MLEKTKLIEKYVIKDIIKIRIANIKKLPKKLQKVAIAITGISLETGDYLPYKTRKEGYSIAGEFLDSASKSDRMKIYKALYFQLAEYVDAGFRLMVNLPYQKDSYRRGFRAPDRPEESRETRVSFLWFLLDEVQYDKDILWYAKYAGYIPHSTSLGYVLAAAIEKMMSTPNKFLTH